MDTNLSHSCIFIIISILTQNNSNINTADFDLWTCKIEKADRRKAPRLGAWRHQTWSSTRSSKIIDNYNRVILHIPSKQTSNETLFYIAIQENKSIEIYSYCMALHWSLNRCNTSTLPTHTHMHNLPYTTSYAHSTALCLALCLACTYADQGIIKLMNIQRDRNTRMHVTLFLFVYLWFIVLFYMYIIMYMLSLI